MFVAFLRHTLFNFFSFLSVCWVSVVLVGRIYDFHTAYIQFLQKIEGEAWLFDKCQEDHFFKNMQYHTDVCEQVVSNRSISPVLHALNTSLQHMKSCGFTDCVTLLGSIYAGGVPVVVCLACLYIVTPSFILPLLQRMHEGYAQRRFLQRCSPLVRGEGRGWHVLAPDKPKMV